MFKSKGEYILFGRTSEVGRFTRLSDAKDEAAKTAPHRLKWKVESVPGKKTWWSNDDDHIVLIEAKT